MTTEAGIAADAGSGAAEPGSSGATRARRRAPESGSCAAARARRRAPESGSCAATRADMGAFTAHDVAAADRSKAQAGTGGNASLTAHADATQRT
ncbi:hypothetical protein LAUMK42_00536 [Mycobacterium persicum]|uniref:Uncharacterized protein n=2 Tax=Mycobacterium persicum TaxID=1487726 RepID=A0AB38UMB7_9MYCO|nr:hypothetical protein [Mycobacterium persicum]VAZ81733.1 hypothetical protein LAUMK42_00536 [Mycobacterium persicum]